VVYIQLRVIIMHNTFEQSRGLKLTSLGSEGRFVRGGGVDQRTLELNPSPDNSNARKSVRGIRRYTKLDIA
jgi:hypothetical protein